MDGRHPVFILDHFKADYKIIPAETKPKNRDEMKEFFTEAFKDSPFITPDIFIPLSEKPKWVEIDKVKEARSQLEIERLKPAPESEKILTPKDIVEKVQSEAKTRAWNISETYECIRYARDNYRLERDLEVRRLLSAVIDFCKECTEHDIRDIPYQIVNQVLIEFKNLKPLKAE